MAPKALSAFWERKWRGGIHLFCPTTEVRHGGQRSCPELSVPTGWGNSSFGGEPFKICSLLIKVEYSDAHRHLTHDNLIHRLIMPNVDALAQSKVAQRDI